MDELLSAQFIVTPTYGTRSRTTLWTTAAGRAHWRECSYDVDGAETERREVTLELDRPAARDTG